MSQRFEPADSLDDFPTPRWATRALIEHVLNPLAVGDLSCWEPTCGRGFMAATLGEYFNSVRASDIHSYGYGEIVDFLSYPLAGPSIDWIITNPPFRLAEEFARRAIERAVMGAAMLVRTGFLEGAGRYERLFARARPALVAQFVERVPILRGRVDQAASTATGYCWIVWSKEAVDQTQFMWIQPCRRELERLGDYNTP